MWLSLLLVACDPAPEDIAKTISSENPVSREDGAKIAQNYDDQVVIEALIKVLADPSEKVRLNAIESLATLDAQEAIPALTDSLNGDPSPAVKKAAADALGRLEAKDAVPDLIAYVEAFTPNDRTQLAGIWALGNIGAQGLPADARASAMKTLVARREGTTDKYILYSANAALRTLH